MKGMSDFLDIIVLLTFFAEIMKKPLGKPFQKCYTGENVWRKSNV
jgi:hypothetical protein